MKLLVSTGPVSRIFVNQVIKRELCRYTRAQAISFLPIDSLTNQPNINYETMRRIENWPNHKEHMHVRIFCPKDSPECIDKPKDISKSTGC